MTLEDFKDIMLIIIGAATSLLGTLLANFLQYRTQQRQLRQNQTKERLMEVRRYLIACLEFVDLVSIPTRLGPDEFGKADYESWVELVEEFAEGWKSIPAMGAARVLYVDDDKVLEDLKRVDTLRVLFYINYRRMPDQATMANYEEEAEELKSLAKKISTRLDELN